MSVRIKGVQHHALLLCVYVLFDLIVQSGLELRILGTVYHNWFSLQLIKKTSFEGLLAAVSQGTGRLSSTSSRRRLS